MVVYELRREVEQRDRDWSRLEALTLFVSVDSAFSRPSFELSVSCSFGPLSTDTTSSASEPVPRFADTSTAKIIRFNNPADISIHHEVSKPA